MLTAPIPPNAMPVVEILRRDVRRPGVPKSSSIAGICLRWTRKRWKGHCCAMGLHPEAKGPNPWDARAFPATRSAIRAFYKWFDGQTDGEAVRDAIWPRNKS